MARAPPGKTAAGITWLHSADARVFNATGDRLVGALVSGALAIVAGEDEQSDVSMAIKYEVAVLRASESAWNSDNRGQGQIWRRDMTWQKEMVAFRLIVVLWASKHNSVIDWN